MKYIVAFLLILLSTNCKHNNSIRIDKVEYNQNLFKFIDGSIEDAGTRYLSPELFDNNKVIGKSIFDFYNYLKQNYKINEIILWKNNQAKYNNINALIFIIEKPNSVNDEQEEANKNQYAISVEIKYSENDNINFEKMNLHNQFDIIVSKQVNRILQQYHLLPKHVPDADIDELD